MPDCNINELYAVYSAESIELFRQGDYRPILVQQAHPHQRAFIHPIVAPDGDGVLTENEPPHHPWQHGLYVGLNEVNHVGFWTEGVTNEPSDGTFHPRPLQEPTVSGNKAQWTVVTDWHAPDGTPMIVEEQRWRLTDCGDTYELDLEWNLTAAIDLTFGRYDYGGLFIRMPFRKEVGGLALNSEGLTREEADGKPARWVAIAMPIEGRDTVAGMALMDHPGNPGHPVPWRVDVQLGTAPSLCIASEWHLQAGESRLFKHRVYVYTDSIDASAIETKWKNFSET